MKENCVSFTIITAKISFTTDILHVNTGPTAILLINYMAKRPTGRLAQTASSDVLCAEEKLHYICIDSSACQKMAICAE